MGVELIDGQEACVPKNCQGECYCRMRVNVGNTATPSFPKSCVYMCSTAPQSPASHWNYASCWCVSTRCIPALFQLIVTFLSTGIDFLFPIPMKAGDKVPIASHPLRSLANLVVNIAKRFKIARHPASFPICT